MTSLVERDAGGWFISLYAILLILVGLTLFVGGAVLAVLGGSWYYLISGVLLAVSGAWIYRRDFAGVWLFTLAFIGTLIWAYSEVGNEHATDEVDAGTATYCWTSSRLIFSSSKT